MSGGSPQQTTTTQLSPEAQQVAAQAFPYAANFAATPLKLYPGSTITPFNPTQQAAQQAAIDAANKAQAGTAQTASDLYAGIPGSISSDIFSDPGIWNKDYNPGTQAAIDAAVRPVYQNLEENVLPNLRSTALGTGPSGGSRAYIAEGLASGRAGQTAADTAAKITEDLYGTNLATVEDRYKANQDAVFKALGLAPTVQTAEISPAATLATVGDVQQQQQQAQLQDLINRYYGRQTLPLIQAQELYNLTGTIPGSTTISTGNVPAPGAGQALGGALTGGQVGFLAGGPLGAGVGAAGGAVLPFLFPHS